MIDHCYCRLLFYVQSYKFKYIFFIINSEFISGGTLRKRIKNKVRIHAINEKIIIIVFYWFSVILECPISMEDKATDCSRYISWNGK